MLYDGQDDAQDDEIARMLRDSARAITDRGVARARQLRFEGPGFDPSVRDEMAGLGWFGTTVAEDLGGSGLGLEAFGGLCRELGSVLTPEPLIETVLAARLLAPVAPGLCAQVVSGKVRPAVAWAEMADGLEVTGAALTRLFVTGIGDCVVVLVPLAVDGRLELHAINTDELEVTEFPQVDGVQTATVRIIGTGRALGALPDGLLTHALDEAALASGFYLCGLAEAALEMSLEYLRERKQFGVPIGSFQALQHRAVNEKIELELAKASCGDAAAALDAGCDATTRALAVSRAKSCASATALGVTRAAIQLHGGIGYTDEHDIGLYLRKAMCVAHAWGSADWHRRRFAELHAVQPVEPENTN